MSDAELDKFLGADPECPMCGVETKWFNGGHIAELCDACAHARPDESYLSWGDHDPSYDY